MDTLNRKFGYDLRFYGYSVIEMENFSLTLFLSIKIKVKGQWRKVKR